MYQPVNEFNVDMKQLQKWKNETNTNTIDASYIYEYFDKIMKEVISTDVIKANADLKKGQMKIPLIARIPESAIPQIFEGSLKIPNRTIFDRIGYHQYTGGTYVVYHFNRILKLFDLHLWFDYKYLKIEKKVDKMTDKELENLVKNYKPNLPDEMTYEFSLVKYVGNVDCHYYEYYEYGIIVKW